MTDEELKKKAEEYSKDHNTVVCCDCSYYDSEEDIEEAYLAGAKELQKENEQLKQELLTYKNAICNKECAEVWGESERLKKENEQLKKDNTELCERLEAVAKESGKALTRQIIAESIVADLPKEKVVWHDLRKNPNDLPKRDGEYLTNIGVLVFDNSFGNSWQTLLCEACDFYEEVSDEVIAWCEIPKFEVEE